jgi:hypothetical protein
MGCLASCAGKVASCRLRHAVVGDAAERSGETGTTSYRLAHARRRRAAS